MDFGVVRRWNPSSVEKIRVPRPILNPFDTQDLLRLCRGTTGWLLAFGSHDPNTARGINTQLHRTIRRFHNGQCNVVAKLDHLRHFARKNEHGKNPSRSAAISGRAADHPARCRNCGFGKAQPQEKSRWQRDFHFGLGFSDGTT